MKRLLLMMLSLSLVVLGGCLLSKDDTNNSNPNLTGETGIIMSGEIVDEETLPTQEDIENEEYTTEDDVVIPAEQKEATDEKIDAVDQKVGELIDERKKTIDTGSDELTEDDIQLIEDVLDELTK